MTSGDLVVSEAFLFPRTAGGCPGPDGFTELTLSLSVPNPLRSADRFIAAYSAAMGKACYGASDATAKIEFWASADKLLSVSAAGSTLTLAIVNQALASTGSLLERQFVNGFDRDLLGTCADHLQRAPG